MNTSENLTNIVESILFGAGRPMRLSEIRSLLGTQNIDAELPKIKIAINALEDRYISSALEIKEVASGFRLQIKNEYGDYLYPLWNDNSNRLSKALMETVSQKALDAWKSHQTTLINERRMDLSNPEARAFLIEEMYKFFDNKEVAQAEGFVEPTKDSGVQSYIPPTPPPII